MFSMPTYIAENPEHVCKNFPSLLISTATLLPETDSTTIHQKLFNNIIKRSSVNSHLYFEHFCSHVYDGHSDPTITPQEYSMLISTSSSRYYCDQSFNTDSNPYSYFEHFANLFRVPYDLDQDKSISNDELLFPGVKYISDNMIIFEMPPAMRHVSYQEQVRDYADGNKYRSFYVPVPWQIYIATYSPDKRLVSVRMFFSKTPLRSVDQKLYVPPMLNFYSNGSLCRPFFSDMEDIEKYPKTIAGIMASAFDWVWNSGFNFDIIESISDYMLSNNFTSMLDATEYDLEKNAPLIKDALNNFYPGQHFGSLTNQIYYIALFFSIWQNVPIEKILDVDWNAFCLYEDFYFRTIKYYISNNFSSEFNEYLSSNNITFIDGDSMPDEVEGYYDEDGNFFQVDDSDDVNYQNLDSLLSSVPFRRFIYNLMLNYNSTFTDAIKAVRHELSGYSNSSLSPVHVFSNRLQNAIQNLSASKSI